MLGDARRLRAAGDFDVHDNPQCSAAYAYPLPGGISCHDGLGMDMRGGQFLVSREVYKSVV